MYNKTSFCYMSTFKSQVPLSIQNYYFCLSVTFTLSATDTTFKAKKHLNACCRRVCVTQRQQL